MLVFNVFDATILVTSFGRSLQCTGTQTGKYTLLVHHLALISFSMKQAVPCPTNRYIENLENEFAFRVGCTSK